jgi:hypothetical protein
MLLASISWPIFMIKCESSYRSADRIVFSRIFFEKLKVTQKFLAFALSEVLHCICTKSPAETLEYSS